MSSGGKSQDAAFSSFIQGRVDEVATHFPGALSADDFLARLESALSEHGFTEANSIAFVNVCRDEATCTLKSKIDATFGASFNINGLGGVITCGVIGIKAGLSHAPIDSAGKERYVFLSFPHIGIDSAGTVGNIGRPGRAGPSGACGALIAATGMISEGGADSCCKDAGAHDAENPEFSILMDRLGRQLQRSGTTGSLNLVQVTKVAEQAITADLEDLISKAVDGSKADYAVVTGVQIHNPPPEGSDSAPGLEIIAPASAYIVSGGKRTEIPLSEVQTPLKAVLQQVKL